MEPIAGDLKEHLAHRQQALCAAKVAAQQNQVEPSLQIHGPWPMALVKSIDSNSLFLHRNERFVQLKPDMRYANVA